MGKSIVDVSHVTKSGKVSWPGCVNAGNVLHRELVTNCFRLSWAWRGSLSLSSVPKSSWCTLWSNFIKKIVGTFKSAEWKIQWGAPKTPEKDKSATQRKRQEGVNWYEMTYKVLNEIFIHAERKKGYFDAVFYLAMFNKYLQN